MITSFSPHPSSNLVRLPVLLLLALALVAAALPVPTPRVVGAVPPAPPAPAPEAARAGAPGAPAQIDSPAAPLAFVPNRGQTDPQVRFQTQALGGADTEYPYAVAVHQTPQSVKAVIVGDTESADFPPAAAQPAFQPTHGGARYDGFVVQLAHPIPLVDLNDGDPANGVDYAPVTWIEADTAGTPNTPIAIVNGAGLTVSAPYTTTLAAAEVRFVDPAGGADEAAISPPDGLAETLLITPTGGIIATYYPISGTLRLTGGATLADYEATLRTLAYNNLSEKPTPGPRRIVVAVSDGVDENQPWAASTVDVVASNDPPQLTLPGPVSLLEEGAVALPGISVADVDAGDSPIQVILSVPGVSGWLGATPRNGATVTGSASSTLRITGPITAVNATLDTLIFVGATDFNTHAGPGNPTFSIQLTVLVSDQGNSGAGGEKMDAGAIPITIDPVNDAPVGPATPPTLTVYEDTPRTIRVVEDLGISDAKDLALPAAPGGAAFPPVLSLTILTPPTKGSIADIDLSAGSMVYTPDPDAYGSDSFQLEVCDRGTPATTSMCLTTTVALTILPVNDAPRFTPGGDVTVDEDSGSYSAPWATGISAGPADEAGQSLSFIVAGNTKPDLFSAGPAIDASGRLSFTPAPDANGFADITVVLRDDGGTANGGADTSAPATFRITVTAVNDAPSFTPGGDVTVDEDSGAYSAPWATGISAGPPDEADQTPIFSVSVTNPALFAAPPAIAADGTLSFTPAPDQHGVVTATVLLTDSGGASAAPVTFTITIVSVNDPPTGVDDRAQVVAGAPATLDVLANDRIAPDVGEALRVTRIITAPLHGTAAVAPDGSGIIYTAAADYRGADSLVYELCDDGSSGAPGPLCATARVELTVVPERFTLFLPMLGNGRPEAASPGRAAARLTPARPA